MFNKRLYSGMLGIIFGTTILFPMSVLAEEQQDERIPMEEVQRFSNALQQIKKYYVKPTTDKDLFDNAIRGMLSGLDPHSSYLDESDFKDLQTATNGEFGGLGLEVTLEDGVVKVITPLVDTPAFKAGIKSGDYIIKLGSKSVQGMSLKEAVEIMRGKVGTTIDLTVVRKGEEKPINFTLVREKILIKSVRSKLYDTHYGYVRLTQFQAPTNKDMLNAIAQLKKDSGGQLKGLVLDLRNNPGGLLDSAIQVSDAFIHNDKRGEEEKIVYTEGRLAGTKFTALANPGDVLDNAPIVVLINNGSASASEIVAGALQANRRAVILGTKSFGKGSVQTVLPLDNERAIKLTTALYFTPDGRSIQAKGITPDIIVEEVSIEKSSEQNPFKGFTEAGLSGHLLNANGDEAPKKTNTPKKVNEPSLIHKDYQLYSALTILKGLAIAQR